MGKVRRYTRDVHISLDDDQWKFVAQELNGGMAHHIRNLIDAYRGQHNSELGELEKEFPGVEAKYLSMKRRIEELKQEEMKRQDEHKVREIRIEEAHGKLIDALKRALWDPAGIQKATYKIYAEYTGLSVEELMRWVQDAAKRRGELEFS